MLNSSQIYSRKHLFIFQGEIHHGNATFFGWRKRRDREVICGSYSRSRAFRQKKAEYNIKIVDFPEFLPTNTLYRISKRGLTFGEAREDQEFHPLYRSQIKTFLDEAYQAFDNAGVFGD